MTLTAGGEDRVIIKGKDKVIRCLLERNIKCGRKSSALSVVVLLVKKKVAGNIHIFKRINHILLGKTEYYLSHEKERAEIAQNGLLTVQKKHNYPERLLTMISLAYGLS